MKKIVLNAIQNDYVKHSNSVDDLKKSIKHAIRRAIDLDLPSALVIVDKTTKKRIQVKKNLEGNFVAQFLED